MFVSRRPDTTIYGMWTVRQFDGQEELPDNHPDVLAGPVKLGPQTQEEQRIALDSDEAAAAKVDAQILTFLNMTPAQLDAWCDANLPVGGTRTMGKVLGRLAQNAARGQRLR